MYTHSYLIKPLLFTVSSDSKNPKEALEKALEKERSILAFLAREIEDRPTIDGSIIHYPLDCGSFCYVPIFDESLRAPVYFPTPVGVGI